ncbi:MAG TPA: hypothetical protein VEJ63_22565, partial [Planctomycetota bacterium]|nr:hypothetical protein [Planctomycetota bacterium]
MQIVRHWLVFMVWMLASQLCGQEKSMLEPEITALTRKLSDAAAAEPLDVEPLRSTLNELYEKSRVLAAEYQKQCIEQHPQLADFLKSRRENESAEFTEAPVVLFGAVTEEQVLAKWREQLRATARGILGIAEHDRAYYGEFMYWGDYEGERKPAYAYVRIEQIRDCCKELKALVALLTLPRKLTRVEAGATIFADDFSGDLKNWTCYGKGEFKVSDKRLHVSGAGLAFWCNQELEDSIVTLDYTPVSAKGNGAGALFAFPGSPVPGKTYEISSGPMDQYNVGINTYHCSLYRGNSGKTNLRRTGPGLKMLSTVTPDACAELKQTYRLTFVKYGRSIQVLV